MRQRAGDVFLHGAFDIRTFDFRKDGAQHVDGDRVQPHGAGREGEASPNHAAEILFHGYVAVDAGGDLDRVVGAASGWRNRRKDPPCA
jgi:hypothetical protein